MHLERPVICKSPYTNTPHLVSGLVNNRTPANKHVMIIQTSSKLLSGLAPKDASAVVSLLGVVTGAHTSANLSRQTVGLSYYTHINQFILDLHAKQEGHNDQRSIVSLFSKGIKRNATSAKRQGQWTSCFKNNDQPIFLCLHVSIRLSGYDHCFLI